MADYAPDTIGHPDYSAQRVLSSKDYSYGQWAVDVNNRGKSLLPGGLTGKNTDNSLRQGQDFP